MIIPFTKSGPATPDAPSETNMLMALAEMQKQGRFSQSGSDEYGGTTEYMMKRYGPDVERWPYKKFQSDPSREFRKDQTIGAPSEEDPYKLSPNELKRRGIR